MLVAVQLILRSPATKWVMAEQEALVIPFHCVHVERLPKRLPMLRSIVVAENEIHIPTHNSPAEFLHTIRASMKDKIP